jgi:hypothetical protein
MPFFDKAKHFWIIFDTSQYPAYYRDVHDLVAAPKGFVMRYQYREHLLSAEAIEFGLKNRQMPILFAYAQKNSKYERQQNKSIPLDDTADTLFIVTRLGKMVNVVRQSERFYFDFQVEAYPDISQTSAATKLFEHLVDVGDAPWNKWVAVSDSIGALAELSKGTEEDNWRRIIEQLGQEPMQFSADAFWRLKGPFTKGGAPVKPKLRSVREAQDVRRVSAEYRCPEKTLWRLQLISSTPKQIAPGRPEYSVEAKCVGSDKLKLIGSGVYALRHYDEQPVEYTSGEMPPYSTGWADLAFHTAPTTENWTAGATLDLRHSIRKSHVLSTLGVLSGAVAAGLLVFGGSKLFENDAFNGAVIVVVGLLLLVAAKYMLTGKIEFSK